MENDYLASQNFFNELKEYLDEYEKLVLKPSFQKDTIQKHYSVIHAWCWYITGYGNLIDFSTLTVSLVNSRFHKYYRHHHDTHLTNTALSNVIRKFLFFVYAHYGIANTFILKKL